MYLNLPFRGPLFAADTRGQPGRTGDLAEGYLLLGVRVQMALHVAAMATNADYSWPGIPAPVLVEEPPDCPIRASAAAGLADRVVLLAGLMPADRCRARRRRSSGLRTAGRQPPAARIAAALPGPADPRGQ
jgi:hypothetical protein